MNLIDLSHVIEDGMITYKGLPAPVICDFLSREESRNLYAPGTEFQIGKIEMVSNTGTYIDCPFHRFADGADLSEVEINRFVNLDAVLITRDYRERIEVGKADFEGVDVAGKAVLVNTNWSERWGTDAYFEMHPFLSEEAATALRDGGALLVGIDSYNIDDTRVNTRPVHTTLLREGILIVEHLCNLHLIGKRSFRFTAAPPRFKGVGTFPVRAYAELLS